MGACKTLISGNWRLGISSDGKWRLNSSHFTDVEVAAPRVREVELMTDTNYRRSATNSQVPVGCVNAVISIPPWWRNT